MKRVYCDERPRGIKKVLVFLWRQQVYFIWGVSLHRQIRRTCSEVEREDVLSGSKLVELLRDVINNLPQLVLVVV